MVNRTVLAFFISVFSWPLTANAFSIDSNKLLLDSETLTKNSGPFVDGVFDCRQSGITEVSVFGKVLFETNSQIRIVCPSIKIMAGGSLLSTNSLELVTQLLVGAEPDASKPSIIGSTRGEKGNDAAPQTNLPPPRSAMGPGSTGGRGQDARCRWEWRGFKSRLNKTPSTPGARGGGGPRGRTGAPGLPGNRGSDGEDGGQIKITAKDVIGTILIISPGGDAGTGSRGGKGGIGGAGGKGGTGGGGGHASGCRSASNGGQGGPGGPGGVGGIGGKGGNGGNGGRGGNVSIETVEAQIADHFEINNAGGVGGPGGPGGVGGPGGPGGPGGLGGCGGNGSITNSGGRCGGVGPGGRLGGVGGVGPGGEPGVNGDPGGLGLVDGQIVPLADFNNIYGS